MVPTRLVDSTFHLVIPAPTTWSQYPERLAAQEPRVGAHDAGGAGGSTVEARELQFVLLGRACDHAVEDRSFCNAGRVKFSDQLTQLGRGKRRRTSMEGVRDSRPRLPCPESARSIDTWAIAIGQLARNDRATSCSGCHEANPATTTEVSGAVRPLPSQAQLVGRHLLGLDLETSITHTRSEQLTRLDREFIPVCFPHDDPCGAIHRNRLGRP